MVKFSHKCISSSPIGFSFKKYLRPISLPYVYHNYGVCVPQHPVASLVNSIKLFCYRQASRESTSSGGKGSKNSLNKDVNGIIKPDKKNLMTVEEAATGNVRNHLSVSLDEAI